MFKEIKKYQYIKIALIYLFLKIKKVKDFYLKCKPHTLSYIHVVRYIDTAKYAKSVTIYTMYLQMY